MANLKFWILLVVAAAIFAFGSRIEALVCKCADSTGATTCKNGKKTCRNETKECFTRITIDLPEHGGNTTFLDQCNDRHYSFKVPAEGNDGTCIKEFFIESTSETCFCNTDLCTPPVPSLSASTTQPRPSTPDYDDDDNGGIVLRGWSLISLSIFASSAIIVRTFVGEQ